MTKKKKILVTLVLLKVISVVKTLFTLNKKKGDHFFWPFQMPVLHEV